MGNAEIYKESIGKLLKETDDIVFEIKSLRRDNQNVTMENDKKIDELQKKLTEIETTMEETLTQSKETAIKPKCGWAHFKALKDKVIFTDATITEIKTEYPNDKDKYIKVTTSESLILKPIKKDLEDGVIVLKEMTKEPQAKRFEYKYTGGE